MLRASRELPLNLRAVADGAYGWRGRVRTLGQRLQAFVANVERMVVAETRASGCAFRGGPRCTVCKPRGLARVALGSMDMNGNAGPASNRPHTVLMCLLQKMGKLHGSGPARRIQK